MTVAQPSPIVLPVQQDTCLSRIEPIATKVEPIATNRLAPKVEPVAKIIDLPIQQSRTPSTSQTIVPSL